MFFRISLKSSKREELIDITPEVRRIIRDSGVKYGVCFLYVPHTTSGIVINENADPSVRSDIEDTLMKLVPKDARYKHLEGNADSHVKSSMVGNTTFVFIENGDLVLGTWQGIFFAEFDGPRRREVYIKIFKEV
ncbi:MAG: secondary thiamine-phosphate synthase enzyme YjbQ [Thermosulfidibacteraceae bacterium]|jgi:secondary thiamine-phosphate synthase enzyme